MFVEMKCLALTWTTDVLSVKVHDQFRLKSTFSLPQSDIIKSSSTDYSNGKTFSIEKKRIPKEWESAR